MKAVVWHDVGDIRVEDVEEPTLQQPTDAIVRLVASAICGTDLHMIRGSMIGMRPGTILGHEGVGIVEQVGKDVRNLSPGDRVVIPSTIGCGFCSYCRDGYTAQCDVVNPPGTAFYGGPNTAGSFQGLQADKARIPYAGFNCVKVPDDISNEQAILLSDIFPTGYFGADLADMKPGHTVAVFGCGPVGQFAIASLKLMDAGRIFAVDSVPSRLEMARRQGAEVVNFEEEDPVETIRRLTGGIGVDRAIDAVGVDAKRPQRGPATEHVNAAQMDAQSQQVHSQRPEEAQWESGDAPTLVQEWAVAALAKAGTLAIIGVYPPQDAYFPIGKALNKNLTIRMGNCNHHKYIARLITLVRAGAIDPTLVLTEVKPLADAVEAYQSFDRREPGWLKVELVPSA
jgi:threonine dehydrogenase-like Zn-dependent dehydrogenase